MRTTRIDASLLSAPITRPGYLIEVDFDPPRYWSTRGAQWWNALTWVSSGWQFAVDKLTLPGGDPQMTQLVLSQGVVGRAASVWAFYGDVADDSNVELLFDGVVDGAPSLVDPITLQLYDQAVAVLYAPRQRIRPELGFSVLPQLGVKIVWNNITIQFKDSAS